MDNKQINNYLLLVDLFKKHGFSLYLVGGTVRDFLLKKSLLDMDIVTDATPDQMLTFLDSKSRLTVFKEYGVIKYKINNSSFDIVTLRKEKHYLDSRHPSKIIFITSLKKDSKRRDFTINGMYLNDRFELFDYVGGKKDLEQRRIRMIGNPNKRIVEDPLRILRAIRFSLMLDFEIDSRLEKAMLKHIELLKKLNSDKISEEIKKIKNVELSKINTKFEKYNIQYLLNMIK